MKLTSDTIAVHRRIDDHEPSLPEAGVEMVTSASGSTNESSEIFESIALRRLLCLATRATNNTPAMTSAEMTNTLVRTGADDINVRTLTTISNTPTAEPNTWASTFRTSQAANGATATPPISKPKTIRLSIAWLPMWVRKPILAANDTTNSDADTDPIARRDRRVAAHGGQAERGP